MILTGDLGKMDIECPVCYETLNLLKCLVNNENYCRKCDNEFEIPIIWKSDREEKEKDSFP